MPNIDYEKMKKAYEDVAGAVVVTPSEPPPKPTVEEAPHPPKPEVKVEVVED